MSHINFVHSALNTTVAALINATKTISSSVALNTTVAGHLNATQTISSATNSLLNPTVSTLLNGTLPISHIQNRTIHTTFGNSTWIPLNNTITNNSSTYGWYYNSSGYWNYTVYCPTCYPNVITIDPPVVTYSYAYTSYIYYVLLLLLLIVAIISIKIGTSRRKELERRTAAQRRRACQQAAAPYTTTNNDSNTNNNNDSDNMTPKDFDLPPAYDDVVQSYVMAKQKQEQQQSQEDNATEGAVGGIIASPSSNNLSTAASTLTIETEISNSNHVSTVDLNQATISSTVNNSASSQQPLSYDNSNEMYAVKNKNDHIV